MAVEMALRKLYCCKEIDFQTHEHWYGQKLTNWQHFLNSFFASLPLLRMTLLIFNCASLLLLWTHKKKILNEILVENIFALLCANWMQFFYSATVDNEDCKQQQQKDISSILCIHSSVLLKIQIVENDNNEIVHRKLSNTEKKLKSHWNSSEIELISSIAYLSTFRIVSSFAISIFSQLKVVCLARQTGTHNLLLNGWSRSIAHKILANELQEIRKVIHHSIDVFFMYFFFEWKWMNYCH